MAIALKVTQQGKYLLSAGMALLLALLVVVVEWLWVTDNERIEQVVHDVRTAVLNSDPEGVLAHLTPDAQYAGPESSMTPEATRHLIREYVSNVHLEFLRIMQLKTSVAQQAPRNSRVSRLGAGWDDDDVKRDSEWNRRDGVVLGFPGNGTGYLENLPNQSDRDSKWLSTSFRRNEFFKRITNGSLFRPQGLPRGQAGAPIRSLPVCYLRSGYSRMINL